MHSFHESAAEVLNCACKDDAERGQAWGHPEVARFTHDHGVKIFRYWKVHVNCYEADVDRGIDSEESLRCDLL